MPAGERADELDAMTMDMSRLLPSVLPQSPWIPCILWPVVLSTSLCVDSPSFPSRYPNVLILLRGLSQAPSL